MMGILFISGGNILAAVGSLFVILYYGSMIKLNVVDKKYSGSWKMYFKSFYKKKQMRVEIIRHTQDKNQTLGVCTVFDDKNNPVFTAISLERGWRNNESNVSCVPEGTYPVVLEYSPRFKQDLWELKEVPNRTECKFHSSNFWHQLNGCIALGVQAIDINKDQYKDVTRSKISMGLFHEVLRGQTEVTLTIKKC